MPLAHTVPIARLLQGAREHSPATVLGVCGHRARLGLDPTLEKSIYPLHPLAEPEQTRPLGRVPVGAAGPCSLDRAGGCSPFSTQRRADGWRGTQHTRESMFRCSSLAFHGQSRSRQDSPHPPPPTRRWQSSSKYKAYLQEVCWILHWKWS